MASGLGTLAKIVAENKNIYRDKLTLKDAQMRIEGIYKPYHAALQELLSQTLNKFGVAVLIDCHSMPPLSTSRKRKPAQIILGDRFGTTCAPALIDQAEKVFSEAGYRVARNQPYAGGYITRSYGQPHHGIHALQIEFSRHLYMNENSRRPHEGFETIQNIATDLVKSLLAIDLSLLAPQKNAAE
ncbi:MAG: N-formylglutamate amidohydrolase [Devosiaceae bacterium]|nr:N-formylglutamate amidohydrolase [Devosiaceae bacterium]